jgi:hypothetical protein
MNAVDVLKWIRVIGSASDDKMRRSRAVGDNAESTWHGKPETMSLNYSIDGFISMQIEGVMAF